MSPDNTSDGWLRKKWVILDGKRCLVKGGSGANRQEPYNEVIASRIMERLGIPHVEYTLHMMDGQPYSVCEDFVTPETEYISAWYLLHTKAKPNHISLYQHYLCLLYTSRLHWISFKIPHRKQTTTAFTTSGQRTRPGIFPLPKR